MRVIAGSAKGVRLEAPRGRRVRPTLDRVREALFSILAPRLDGARFLDLFAGTGANGIEALSRGAAHCTFVESEPACVGLIGRNLERARLVERAEVRQGRLPGALSALPAGSGPFDLIFADPPYNYSDFNGLLQCIREEGLLAAGGLIILEHPSRTAMPEGIEGYVRQRETRYGDTGLSFFG